MRACGVRGVPGKGKRKIKVGVRACLPACIAARIILSSLMFMSIFAMQDVQHCHVYGSCIRNMKQGDLKTRACNQQGNHKKTHTCDTYASFWGLECLQAIGLGDAFVPRCYGMWRRQARHFNLGGDG
jgi:hypothetical protein